MCRKAIQEVPDNNSLRVVEADQVLVVDSMVVEEGQSELG